MRTPLLVGYGKSAGRAALFRALPQYCTLLILWGVLFEGNGVRPADLVQQWAVAPGFRLSLFGAWALLSAPAVLALLTEPSSFFLRHLPVSRARFACLVGGCLLLAELPCFYIWTRGGGLLGLGASALCLALTTWGAQLRLRQPVAPLCFTGTLLCAAFQHWALWLALGIPLAAAGAVSLYRRAPELHDQNKLRDLSGSPISALFRAHTVLLWRVARPQLGRAVLFLGVSALLSIAAVKNGNVARDTQLPVYVTRFLLPALVFGSAGLLRPFHETELKLVWAAAPTQTPIRWSNAVSQLCHWALFSMLGIAHAGFFGALLHLTLPQTIYLLSAQLVTCGSVSLIISATRGWVFEKAALSTRRVLFAGGATLLISETLFLSLTPLPLLLLLTLVSLSFLAYWSRVLLRDNASIFCRVSPC